MSPSWPLRRVLLWSFLVAAILAVVVTFLLAPRWAEEGRARLEPPPILDALPDFALTHHDGRTVSLADLRGAPWVADFVFTRCRGNCPRLTEAMTTLVDRLGPGPPIHRVSFSVDPEHDTPEVLGRYALEHGAIDERWLFLTGESEEMTSLIVEGFKLGFGGQLEPVSSVEPILHTTRFVLVDGGGRIRGYYDIFRAEERERLLRDLESLRRTVDEGNASG